MSDEHGTQGGIVDHLGLICRIDRADRDSVDLLRQQIIDNPALLCGRAVGWNSELDLDIRQFGIRLFGAPARNRPEVRGVVRNESQAEGP
jgi:hypothetical protein